jgi:ABC-2 type transport system permease protein
MRIADGAWSRHSIAFNGMMFLLMVRVEDPLVPRAMFGILNVLLLSLGRHVSHLVVSQVDAGYWRGRSFHVCDPRLQGGNAEVFGITTLLVATPLFKRTLNCSREDRIRDGPFKCQG